MQEDLDQKPESLKCTLENGSTTRVMVWSRPSTNKQFFLHINKACTTAKEMGLIQSVDDAKNMTVLSELANDPLSKAKAEKKTAEWSC